MVFLRELTNKVEQFKELRFRIFHILIQTNPNAYGNTDLSSFEDAEKQLLEQRSNVLDLKNHYLGDDGLLDLIGRLLLMLCALTRRFLLDDTLTFFLQFFSLQTIYGPIQNMQN